MVCIAFNWILDQCSSPLYFFPTVFPSLVCLCVYWCSLKLGWSAACVCARTFLSPSNVSAYQKSVICYLYKTRRLLFQSMPLVFLSFSLLSEMSNFSVTFPSSVSWYNMRSPTAFTPLRLFSPPFWDFFPLFFRDSLTISLEIFHQIAGEYITPKLVARRGNITMLLKSVQISQQQRSCHLLTICQISCGGEHHPSLLYMLYSVKYYDGKQTVCMVWRTGYFGDLWNVANKHKRPNLSVLLDIRRNQSNLA